MSRHLFDWAYDDDYAIWGWRLRGMSHFNATDWMAIAHDTMEHLPGGIKHGAVADELMALGARLYLRVHSGWWKAQRFFGPPEDAWTNEVHRQLEFIDGGTPEPPPAAEPPCPDIKMDRILQYAVRRGIERHRAKLDDDSFDRAGDLAQAFLAWLRRGYRAGMARWQDAGVEYVMLLQEQVGEEVRRMGCCEPGQVLEVRINESTCYVHTRLCGREERFGG